MSLQSILRDGDRQNLWTAAKICWQGSTWWLWLVFGLLVSFLVCWSVGWFLVCWSVFGFWFVTRFCLLVFGLLVSFWLVGGIGFSSFVGFWLPDWFLVCWSVFLFSVGWWHWCTNSQSRPPSSWGRASVTRNHRSTPACFLPCYLLACLFARC